MRVRDAFLVGAMLLLTFVGLDALLRVFWAEHSEWVNEALLAAGFVAAGYIVTWLAMEVIERREK